MARAPVQAQWLHPDCELRTANCKLLIILPALVVTAVKSGLHFSAPKMGRTDCATGVHRRPVSDVMIPRWYRGSTCISGVWLTADCGEGGVQVEQQTERRIKHCRLVHSRVLRTLA